MPFTQSNLCLVSCRAEGVNFGNGTTEGPHWSEWWVDQRPIHRPLSPHTGLQIVQISVREWHLQCKSPSPGTLSYFSAQHPAQLSVLCCSYHRHLGKCCYDIILDLSDSINIDCSILHACLSRITLSQGNSQCKLLLSMTNMEDKTIGLPTSFLIQNTQNALGRWGVFIWGYLWQFSHKKYHQFPSLVPIIPELVRSYLTSSKNSNLWSAFLGELSLKYENKDFLITPYQPFIL